MIYAGIDGGGTKTTLVLCDKEGNQLTRKIFGSFNLNSIGEAAFRTLLAELFATIGQWGECGRVGIGAAGVSNPAVSRIVTEVAASYGLRGRIELKGDQEIALYGATGGRPGCILIAGTGSICTGMDECGRIVRTGGWGHLIDDAGSGYALGRDALAALVRAQDGRGEATLLTEFILTKLAVREPEELIAAIYGAEDKSLIASLAVAVEQAGRKQDQTALRILSHNGRALAELVAAVSKQINMSHMPLILMGGLLMHETLLREAAVAEIKASLPQVRLTEAVMDGAAGAALLAINHD